MNLWINAEKIMMYGKQTKGEESGIERCRGEKLSIGKDSDDEAKIVTLRQKHCEIEWGRMIARVRADWWCPQFGKF